MRTDPSPLWSALQGSVEELEVTLARWGQGVGALGILISLYVTVFVAPALGFPLAAVSGSTLIWFLVSHHFLQRREHLKLFRFASPVVELGMVGLVLLVLVETEGPAYALGSWVPPMLFTIFVLGAIARLDPLLPLLLGAVGAAEFGAIYVLAILPRLGPTPELLHQPAMQLTRMGSLVLMGAAGSLAVRGLMHAVGQASHAMRSQELFGKYHIEREIASGGMGRVLQARYCPEGGFQRRVAIKIIHPNLAQDPVIVDRFRNEAALSAWLGHPNIVQALDFGSVDDTYFFAMEYVDGATLKQVLDHLIATGAQLHPRLVVYLGQQLAAGLHFAHAVARDDRGILLRVVHRDLSPSNVLLGRSGQVKISDFGVADVLQHARSNPELLVGKPSYMAPEQVRQRPVDPRSDLYTLGVVLWELLATRRLFRRSNELLSLRAVLEDPVPPITELRPDLGAHWVEFFHTALARDPSTRFSSAAEMLDAFTAFQLLEGVVQAEEIAALVSTVVDIPELDLDPATETVEVPDSPTDKMPL